MIEYLIKINQMLKHLDESDLKFIAQIYTLLKRHLEKKRRH